MHFVFRSQQFNKAMMTSEWPVIYKIKAGQRGYEGINLQRSRRQPPGFEFGGRQMLQRVRSYMEMNPPPLPPIEVIMLLNFFGH